MGGLPFIADMEKNIWVRGDAGEKLQATAADRHPGAKNERKSAAIMPNHKPKDSMRDTR